jgi:hypothetical protein
VRVDATDLLVLRELPGIGERTVVRTIERARRRGETLRAVLEASPATLSAIYGFPPSAIERLSQQRDRHLHRCHWILAELDRAGGRLLTEVSPNFPVRLQRSLRHPPPMLFALGNHRLLERPCIAMLSSREIVEQTVPAIVAVVRTAKDNGWVLATGGMKSTHRLAAISARAGAADRIVVLDRGLFATFASDFRSDPFGCGKRPARLDLHRTLILSSFRPEDHAAPSSGRRRDEIIAALGNVIFAASARPGGETERICEDALARRTPVWLWSASENGRLTSAGARRVDAASVSALVRQLSAPARKVAPRAPSSGSSSISPDRDRKR